MVVVISIDLKEQDFSVYNCVQLVYTLKYI